MILKRIVFGFLLLFFVNAQEDATMSTSLEPYTDKNGTWCPCHYFAHSTVDSSGNHSFICVSVVPLSAASAKDSDSNDTEENVDTEDNFQYEYVNKACEYYGGEALKFEDVNEAEDAGVTYA